MSKSTPNTEPKKEISEEMGFCAKDGEYSPLAKGCRHPKDYCPHRKSCLIHFLEKEHKS